MQDKEIILYLGKEIEKGVKEIRRKSYMGKDWWSGYVYALREARKEITENKEHQ